MCDNINDTNTIKYKNTYLFIAVFDSVIYNPTKYTNIIDKTHAQKYPDVNDCVFNTTAAPASIVNDKTIDVMIIGITPSTIKLIPGLFIINSTTFI